jgi:hypothetical protein
MKRKGIILIIALVVCLIGLAITSYLILTNLKQCSTEECFTQALVNCNKVSFEKDDGANIMKYTILGQNGLNCDVNVQVVQVKKGAAELAILEGKDMICSAPLGLDADPAKSLKDCHGTLKEEIQNIIIQRMHSQIVENIGKISEETTKII